MVLDLGARWDGLFFDFFLFYCFEHFFMNIVSRARNGRIVSRVGKITIAHKVAAESNKTTGKSAPNLQKFPSRSRKSWNESYPLT